MMLKKIIIFVLLLISFQGVDAQDNAYYNEGIYQKYLLKFENNLGDFLESQDYSAKSNILENSLQATLKIENSEISVKRKTEIFSMLEALNTVVSLSLGKDFLELKGVHKAILITDKRCIFCGNLAYHSINSENMIKDLEVETGLTIEYMVYDYTSENIPQWLEKFDIDTLPVFLIETEDQTLIDTMGERFEALGSDVYSLVDMGKYDVKFSDMFVQIAREEVKQKILDNLFIKNVTLPEVVWLQFSDLDCEACGILTNRHMEKLFSSLYGENFGRMFFHYPLNYHEEARMKSELIGCISGETGVEGYYQYIYENYQEGYTALELLDKAGKNGLNINNLNSCIIEKSYSSMIDTHIEIGKELGITSTPSNFLFNTKTGEYIAVPFYATSSSNFQKAIEKLLY